MMLEQEYLDSRIQEVEATVIKLLEKSEIAESEDSNQNFIESCLQIFGQLRNYEKDLSRIIDELNQEVLGRGAQDPEDFERAVDITANNFFNSISSIELQLTKIQASLAELR